MRTISRGAARRAVISSLGLSRSARPAGRVDTRHIAKVMRTIGALQIDSVNVVERAHHIKLFSRLGPYDTGLLGRSMAQRDVFEYWGHVAAYLPIEHWPLWQHKMEANLREPFQRAAALMEAEPAYVDGVLAQVAERGPLSVSDLDDPGERSAKAWWGWSKGKVALEWLFAAGKVTADSRRGNMVRYYDIPERVIPAEIRALPAPSRSEAHRELLMRAVQHMTLGTAKGLADHFRLPIIEARAAVADLVSQGRLLQVEVPGWNEPTFTHADATFPNRVNARALVAPFDPLVWFRERASRLFDFDYTIEIYVPEPKRVYGYYVFPFLLDDRIVARVDLKADRATGRLLAKGVFSEEGVDHLRVARELAAELGEMAEWLGMAELEVGTKGDLAAAVRTEISRG